MFRRAKRAPQAPEAPSDRLAKWRAGPLGQGERKACHLQEALASTSDLEGSIVECGVATAWSLSVIAHAVRRSGSQKMIYAVDSYEGFPALSEHDADWFDPETMKLHYKLFDIEFARLNLRGSGLSETEVDSVTFVKGWIPEVLGQVSGPIAVLHLDLDIYQSYADSLRILWPQVLPGAWILFDEYDQGRDEEKWLGAKKAIDEFVEQNSLTLQRHWSGFTHVVKPL